MALSSVEYTGDGSTQTFSLTFPYLSQDHVQVFIDGAEDTTFTWPTSSTVTLSSVPTNGAVVKISRTTPSTPLVDFVDGSNLTEDYLDTATRQSLYVAEETRDNFQTASVGGIADGSIEPVKLSASFGSWVKSASAALARAALEVIGITGGTFTGNIQVPNQPYNEAVWNGNNEVPTKGDVRDEIESVKSSLITKFTSSDQAITNGTTLTVAHGLGVAPFSFWYELVCVTDEGGYSSGDVISDSQSGHTASSSAQDYGATLEVDSTNIYVIIGDEGFYVNDRATNDRATLTPANWRVRVKAWV